MNVAEPDEAVALEAQGFVYRFETKAGRVYRANPTQCMDAEDAFATVIDFRDDPQQTTDDLLFIVLPDHEVREVRVAKKDAAA